MICLFFSSLLQLLLYPELVVSLLTQSQPLSLGNIISVISLFQAFKLGALFLFLMVHSIVSHCFSCSSSPCGSSSWPMLPFHICLKLSTAVMPPFTQSQGWPPLVCFLIMMSEVQVPFLSLCMTTSSLTLLPWVIWSCVYPYSWLYTPCFSSSAFGALPYLSILVPSFVFWQLAHTWKINPNHLECFLSSNLNRSLSFWSSSSHFYVFS